MFICVAWYWSLCVYVEGAHVSLEENVRCHAPPFSALSLSDRVSH